MSKSFPFLANPFDRVKTSDDAWALFVKRQRARGFDGVLVYNYALAPVRGHHAAADRFTNRVTGEANNMVFLINTPSDPEALTEFYMRHRLSEIDPRSYDLARRVSEPRIQGIDFLEKTMPNYDDALQYWTKLKDFGFRNSFLVPVAQMTNKLPCAFGLHTTMGGKEFQAMLEAQHNQILLDCFRFSPRFNALYRKEYARKSGITSRQYEVMRLISQGMSNMEIAEHLGISMPSVSFHLKSLKERLELDTTREIPVAAARLGFVDLT